MRRNVEEWFNRARTWLSLDWETTPDLGAVANIEAAVGGQVQGAGSRLR